MPDNVETFVFDASQAISELNKLDSAVDRVNASVGTLNVTSNGISSVAPFDGATKSVEKYAKSAKRSLDQVTRSSNQSTTSIKQIGVSWNTIGRIIQTQVIIGVLQNVRQLFFEAADAAEEFQITVARIRGIADGALGNIEEDLRSIATTLGRDLGEVSEAALEAFQNDLAGTEETVGLLSGAIGDLALVTDGTLGQAVNTVTPIIKAYGLNIEEARGVTAELFNLIDSGVITIEELDGSLGTVVPIAKQLGIEFKEVAAAIATGTLAGVDGAKSMTQLRNVLVKLTKPTEELKAAFQTLGVSTGQELLENTDNLRDALEQIFNALDRDPERFAKAFNTIRGQLGAINIQLENAGKFEFDRILNESATAGEKLARALDLIKDTDAFESRQQAAEMNVILTDLGNTAIEVKNFVRGLFLDLVPDAEAAKAGIAGVTLAVGTYAAAWTGLLAVPFATAFPVAAAVAFGAALGIQASKGIDVIRDKLNNLGVDFDRIVREQRSLQIVQEGEAERLVELNEKLGDTESQLFGLSQAGKLAFSEILATAEEAGSAIAETFDDAVAVFERGSTQLFKDLDSAVQGIDDAFADAVSSFDSITQKIADFDFEQGLEGLTEGTRLVREQERATNQLSKARALLSRLEAGGTDVTREQVIEAFKLAEEFARAADKTADSVGSMNQQKIASEAVRESMVGQQRATQGLVNNLAEAKRQDLTKDALAAKKQFAEITQNVREYQQLLRSRNPDGTTKDAEQIKEDFEAAQQLLPQIKSDLAEFEDLEIFGQLELQDEVAALKTDIEAAINEVVVDWSQNVEDLQTALNEHGAFEAEVNFNANAQNLADQIGNDELSKLIDEASAGASSPSERTTAISRAIADTISSQTEIEGNLRIIEQGIRTVEAQIDGAQQKLQNTSFFGNISEEAAKASSLFQGIANSAGTASEQAAFRLRSSLNQAIAEVRENVRTGLISQEEGTALEQVYLQAFDKIDLRLQQIEQQGEFNPELLEGAREFQGAADEINEEGINPQVDTSGVNNLNTKVATTVVNAKKAEVEVRKIGPAASSGIGPAGTLASTVGSIGTSATNAIGPVNQLISRLQQAINLQGQLNGGGGGFAFHGGRVDYRQAGGTGRGQDTQAAFLDPQEMVINARSSRNFFSQLQAINSGSTSASGGGGDTTINVGDITVNSTSQLPNETARQVGQSIQREIRRRTFRL